MDDLAKATDIARNMVMRYGMDQKVGQVAYEEQRSVFLDRPTSAQPRSYSEETAREIDCAIRALVNSAFEKAVALLDKRRQDLEKGATMLLNKETLVDADLKEFTA